MAVTHRTALRFIPVVAAVALLVTACATPAGGTATPAPAESTASPSLDPTPSATPSPIESQATDDEISLPSSCDELFAGDLRATLDAEIAPLNDPGVTMYSTENAEALTVLESGVPSLRCTWGTPSDRGIATTVSIVSPAQSDLIVDALTSSGFGSEEASGGMYFRTSQRMLSMDEEVVDLGETHFLRGNVWVATRWVNYGPDAYTPGIVAQLWP
ncbi:hypothetical protein A9Z40_01365 [Microbacterium arborescens]|jgi:hypothetical protein|uniref:Uncharacterized protein n=1 Tax=Microbacterium arborescens TaxID=33883 RepID=A0ABX2WP38_9MICO|nr:hypothetical protein [Microbacterium arborescens]OAZ45776.1 hypothetical protein A9Z40_01365 [Microbacterium arborescens]